MHTVIDPSLFHALFNQAAQPWSIQLKKQRFICSETLATSLGLHSVNISLTELFALLDEANVFRCKEAIKRASETGKTQQRKLVVQVANTPYLIDLKINQGQIGAISLHGTMQILVQFLKPEQELYLLKKLFHESKNGLMVADTNHYVLMANQEFCYETGYQGDELIGVHASAIKSNHYDQDFYQKLWDNINRHGYWEGELLAKTKSGQDYAHEALIKCIEIDGKNFYATTTRKLDASLASLAQQKAHQPAITLPNKADFEAQLEQLYLGLRSDRTLVCMAFNAAMSGTISPEMQAWLISQRFDSMNVDGYLAQLSPSMFGLFWQSEKKVDKINAVLWSIMRRLSGTRKDDALKLAPVLTVGCSVLAIDATSPKQLLAHAIQALIANQQQSSPTLYYFDRRLSKRFDRVAKLTKLLDQALQADKIEVYYQPIVRLPELTICKFEALFRTNLETDIEYNTQELIQIAEKNGWIDRIDATVARLAMRDLPILQQHFNDNNIGISINRSLQSDLLNVSCLEETVQILSNANTNLEQVTLELTESAFFQDLSRQKVWIDKLRSIGVQLAIDDFGTGYSSFSYLLNLPVSIIKIDKLFIDNIKPASAEMAMIDMLTTLSHKMGGKVIVEGVESAPQLTLLSQLNVDMLQGYLFSQPKSLAEILNDKGKAHYGHLAHHLYHAPPQTAAEVMTTTFISLGIDDRLSKAKALFDHHDIQHLVVIENSQCRGILTRSQLMAELSPYLDTKSEQQRDKLTLNKRIHQVMNKNPKTLPSNTPIALCHQWLQAHWHDVIVVHGSVNVCLGVITAKELLSLCCNRLLGQKKQPPEGGC
ncbi:EAL domain-containing protein [Motilimonas eburnea]|uniref:EAL domain-containing protein n=1 Tax=Motilimonas eburnea TaxID=1737488 RepID=UPI001E62A374|nr:EAL domain-containing protein [Motilimonas eburnea]MCE2572858.1 EAL domain-containing protein [Motilimonas eburnea]